MLGLIQIPPNQCQQIGRCFVATWKAAIQCFQVPPAHGSFNVLNASPLFEKSPEGFAVQGVARFEFANGQLGLGHVVSQHRLNLRNRGPPPLVEGPFHAQFNQAMQSISTFEPLGNAAT